MRPPYGRRSEDGGQDWRPIYEWRAPVSDAWVFADAVVTVLTGLLTIVYLIVRHPITALTMAVFVAIVGTVAGWW